LIEADGSRRRPLKAPAAHEPVIPGWAEHVVVIAGLSALGKPLSSEWVHRPERFAALTGLQPDEPITPDALARVLMHAQGGLKGIPNHARRSVMLNQANTAEAQAAGGRISKALLSLYDSVLVASLAPPGEHSEPQDSVLAVHEPVAGIVLAAGKASRMGQPKQTLTWRGEALVRHATRIAISAGLSPVVVVTGFAAEAVSAAVADLPVICTHNPHWDHGQSTSVIAGIQALPKASAGAIFLLADQPTIPVNLVHSLVETHARTLGAITAPLIDGQRANPVLFDRHVFPELLELSGDVGGRAIFSRHRVTWLPWHDDLPLFDIDSPEDYARLCKIQ
jgi:molybdenum cofactor cytidylyltransferase